MMSDFLHVTIGEFYIKLLMCLMLSCMGPVAWVNVVNVPCMMYGVCMLETVRSPIMKKGFVQVCLFDRKHVFSSPH